MKEIKLIMAAVAISLSAGFVSCSEDDNNEAELPIAVAVNNSYPSDFIAKDATFKSGIITFTELNTQKQTVVNLTGIDDKFDTTLPVGVYDYKGEINYTVKLADNSTKDLVLRTVGNSVAVSQATTLSFDWFMSNPSQGLVLSEIYAAGSFNAKKTGGIRDNYIRIYNNSDATLYADGLAICESDFVNSKTNNNTILTEAHFRENNFTAGAVWVIPGNGKEVPVEPGKYITIADRAVNWGEETEGGLNLTGADFEWYDDHKLDTDNPDVPNLEKWFSYSATIWVMSNQCNRSYALVRMPEGMTVDKYLAEYKGSYEYINSTTGSHMTKEKAYLIPNSWIIDGVNLSNAADFVQGALATSIDAGYAKISDITKDPNRFTKVFVRKTAFTAADGRVVLQDTDDSSADFLTTTAK